LAPILSGLSNKSLDICRSHPLMGGKAPRMKSLRIYLTHHLASRGKDINLILHRYLHAGCIRIVRIGRPLPCWCLRLYFSISGSSFLYPRLACMPSRRLRWLRASAEAIFHKPHIFANSAFGSFPCTMKNPWTWRSRVWSSWIVATNGTLSPNCVFMCSRVFLVISHKFRSLRVSSLTGWKLMTNL
jgi:hypothetical protein